MDKYIFNYDKIGELDAESDSEFLKDCYIESSLFSKLGDFDNTPRHKVLVGRTGAGKTALLQKLSEAQKNPSKAIEIKTEDAFLQYIENKSIFSELKEKDVNFTLFFKTLWVHVLLIHICSSFKDGFLESFGQSKKSKEYVELFGGSFFNENSIETIVSSIEKNAGLGAQVPGIVNASGQQITNEQHEITRHTNEYISTKLLSSQKELLEEIENNTDKYIRILIYIDDLDSRWEATKKIKNELISALMDSLREFEKLSKTKILVSMRTDILLEMYSTCDRQREKDQSRLVEISWGKQDIKRIVDKRIASLIKHKYAKTTEVTFEEVFNFKIQQENAFDYIYSRTMSRPRDIIKFINQCLSIEDAEVNEGVVTSAISEYYEDRTQALHDEWKNIYGNNINHYIAATTKIKKLEFSLDDGDSGLAEAIDYLNHACDPDDFSLKITEDKKELLRIWFRIGIVGLASTQKKTWSSLSKSDLNERDFASGTFVLNKLFHV